MAGWETESDQAEHSPACLQVGAPAAAAPAIPSAPSAATNSARLRSARGVVWLLPGPNQCREGRWSKLLRPALLYLSVRPTTLPAPCLPWEMRPQPVPWSGPLPRQLVLPCKRACC